MAQVEDTLDQILRKLEGKEELKGVDSRTLLEKCFTKVPSKKKQEDAESWLAWASRHKDVKVISSPIPANILPPGITGSLTDVKVQSRGPDDAIYDKHKDLRDKLARGNCFITVERRDGKMMESATSLIVYGLKKFTGGLGDDDDRDSGDNFTWKRYFTQPLESTTHIVCTRKANGEAAHLAAKRIGGKIYFCAGSKNVHMLFRNQEDLKHYTEGRYKVAAEVARAIVTLLDKMDEKQKDLLLSFLCATEFTGIFEVLQPTYQHVEDLSHLSGPEVRFITWTSSNLDPDVSSLCSLPPHLAIEVAASLGLPTVSYDVIPFVEVESRMTSVREGYQYEGEVLYFMDENSQVIGLLKKKTIWYIICRAIREKVRHACAQQAKANFSVSTSIQKIEKRMKEIQSWLGLDDESTETWMKLGIGYLKWTLNKLSAGEVEMQEIVEMFPVQWKKYLEDVGETDRVQSKWTEPSGSDD